MANNRNETIAPGRMGQRLSGVHNNNKPSRMGNRKGKQVDHGQTPTNNTKDTQGNTKNRNTKEQRRRVEQQRPPYGQNTSRRKKSRSYAQRHDRLRSNRTLHRPRTMRQIRNTNTKNKKITRGLPRRWTAKRHRPYHAHGRNNNDNRKSPRTGNIPSRKLGTP